MQASYLSDHQSDWSLLPKHSPVPENSSRVTSDGLDRINVLLAECSDLVQDLFLAFTLLFGKVDGEVDSNGRREQGHRERLVPFGCQDSICEE
jgi:hypothetical protein